MEGALHAYREKKSCVPAAGFGHALGRESEIYLPGTHVRILAPKRGRSQPQERKTSSPYTHAMPPPWGWSNRSRTECGVEDSTLGFSDNASKANDNGNWERP